jgi:hypothetical protein
MSTRRTSTLAAAAISLLVLAVLVLFVALGSGDDEPDGDAGEAGDSVPSGFQRIPEDIFFERIFGSQRTAGSWHFEQEKTIGGMTGVTLSVDTEIGSGVAEHAAKTTFCCDQKSGEVVPIDVIVADGVYYAKIADAQAWWRLDPTKDARAAELARVLSGLISQDTSAGLQEVVQSNTVVGPDLVDGVDTVHYNLTIADPAPAAPPTDATAPANPAIAFVDVWVDADDRPVKMVLTVGDGRQELVTTTTYSRYGEDFPIAAPPAGQVTSSPPKKATVPRAR